MNIRFLICLISLLLMSTISLAQVPRYITHQGFLTKATGEPYDTAIAMTLRLFQDSTGGASQYDQTISSVQVTKGVFTVTIGSIPLAFDKQYWLEVQAGSQTMTPRIRLTSAAYSLGPWSTSSNDIYYNNGNVGIGTTSPQRLLELSSIADYTLRIGNGAGAGTAYTYDIGRLGATGELKFFGNQPNATGYIFSSVDREMMRITNAGNVGIGTTTPGYPLEVSTTGTALSLVNPSGNRHLTLAPPASGTPATIYSDDNAGMKFNTNASGYLRFYPGGTEKVTFDNNGNVGIGTTVPSEKLNVSGGNILASGSITGDLVYASRGSNSMVLNGDYAGWHTHAQLGSTLAMRLAPGNLDAMTLLTSGNVGIGTTSPQGLFHVSADKNTTYDSSFVVTSAGWVGIGTAAPTSGLSFGRAAGIVSSITVASSDGSDDAGLKLAGGGAAESDTRGAWINLFGNEHTSTGKVVISAGNVTNGDIYFRTGGSERVRILNNGNVGIGTTGPVGKLHIYSAASGVTTAHESADELVIEGSGYTGISILTPNNQRGYLMFGDPEQSDRGFIAYQHTEDVMRLGVSGAEKVRIQSNGNVGIGTTSPANILTVVQSSSTDPIADAWTTYSSRRWKKNIKQLEGSLEKVEHLQGVSFDWKVDNKHDIGLIAEEVGKIVPEVVAYEENGSDAKSVDYARLVVVLIEAIKEQQKEIKDLKERMVRIEKDALRDLGEMRK